MIGELGEIRNDCGGDAAAGDAAGGEIDGGVENGVGRVGDGEANVMRAAGGDECDRRELGCHTT